jgi:predicted Zn-ribbon and HTH transcriptional regulator
MAIIIGIILFLGVVSMYQTNKKQREELRRKAIIMKCSSCGWKGTTGKLEEKGGECPNCKSDLVFKA